MPGQFGSDTGDSRYRAPEVQSGQYNEYADMYMLGRTMMEVYHQPSNWRNLAERLLSQNPAERVTASFVREVAEQNLGYIGGNGR